MLQYVHVAGRIFDRPLLITPAKLQTILWALRERFDLDIPDPDMRPQWQLFRPPPEARFDETGGYRVLDGVAIMPVFGTLVQKAAGLDALSGLVSYERLTERLEHALDNAAVRSIMLNMDTPGGEANELFDLVDLIFEARERKPMVAMVADEADSAGYAIASATGEIVVTRTASVGSIGVVATHRSEAEANTKRGVVYTHIFAGDHKVDGSPYLPLSESARAEFQSEVDRLYGMFVASVARNRALTEQAVIDTQARIYTGAQAVEMGLADRVSTAREELDRLREQARSSARQISLHTPKRSTAMTTENHIALTQSELDNQLQAARSEGEAAGRKAGAVAERERIGSILDHEQAADRQTLARHLALHTDSTVDQAAAALAASPVEKPNNGNRLEEAMRRTEQPNVSAEDPDSGAQQQAPRKALSAAFEARQRHH